MEKQMGTDKTKTEIKFKVHIVNSVKGGSGKSTFSLLLADHFVRNGEDAYVIDLDLCGTSWYSDFNGFWQEEPRKFIQDLMYSPCEKGFATDVWAKLKVRSKDELGDYVNRQINVCISAQDQNERLCDTPDVELLEHITYRLITEALTENGEKRGGIHFILDLPPSHEAAAEQICHRLFFDNNSLLNQNEDYCGKFYINLYMMTPVDQISAWKKNKAYVHNLIYGQRKYSSTIRSFLEAPDQRMKICFVIIDNHGWHNLMPSRNIESDMSTLKSSLKSDIQSNKIDKIFETFNYVYLPFVDFEFKRKINIFDEKAVNIPLDFGTYRGGVIDSIVNDLA